MTVHVPRSKGRRLLFLAVSFAVCFVVSIRRPVHVSDDSDLRIKPWQSRSINSLKYNAEDVSPKPNSKPSGDGGDKASEDTDIVTLPPPVPEVIVSPTPVNAEKTTQRPSSLTSRPKTSPTTVSEINRKAPTHSTTSSPTPNTSVAWKPLEEECTPPAYHEFPPDLFTHSQRSHGAVVVHIAVIMYMFYAVAIVCDDFFIGSLEECCERLQLSEDVAGATFMAAGSSAPELFTAILGVLVAKGDVGTGTIVGSAVFNILFVIGICGIFAGRIVELTWWPLFRDSMFYSLTVVVLICFIFDSEITWYESVIMMCMYSVYIIIMKFSNELRFWFSRKLGIAEDDLASMGILGQNDKKNYSSYVPFNNEIDEMAIPGSARFHNRSTDLPADEAIRDGLNNRMSLYDAALRILMKRHFPPKTRFRAAAHRIMLEHERRRNDQPDVNRQMQTQISLDSGDPTKLKSKSSHMGITSDTDWRKIPSFNDGPLVVFRWIVSTPLQAVLHYTIPNCKEERWRKFFMLTFVMSITWTAVFSYVMVWMVTLVGYTLGIPDSVMGITFLAAGTSVPDAFASLIVAKQGQGDMAVSNSIGSNVFDILIGLAFPWFLQTAIVEPGSIATINSRGMVYSVVLLFLTIIVTIGGIYFSRWQLTPRLGYLLLSVYSLFLIVSVLLEFNVLGYVSPPMCPD